jgi:hypothetical protein
MGSGTSNAFYVDLSSGAVYANLLRNYTLTISALCE